jgi:hypothetical protein
MDAKEIFKIRDWLNPCAPAGRGARQGAAYPIRARTGARSETIVDPQCPSRERRIDDDSPIDTGADRHTIAPMRRLAFWIPEDLDEGLKALKAEHGTPEAETIRRALKAYLSEKGTLKPDRKPAKQARKKRS